MTLSSRYDIRSYPLTRIYNKIPFPRTVAPMYESSHEYPPPFSKASMHGDRPSALRPNNTSYWSTHPSQAARYTRKLRRLSAGYAAALSLEELASETGIRTARGLGLCRDGPLGTIPLPPRSQQPSAG